MTTQVAEGRLAVERFFELSLFLFVATGFATAAATGKLDPASVLVVSIALGVRALGFAGILRVNLSPALVTRLTIGYILFYALDYFVLSGSFVDATGHLIFFVMLMKLFSARVNRDYVYLATIAFMQMLLAAILTIDTSFLAFFLVFLVFGIATFTSYEMRRSYARAANPAEAPKGPMLRGLGITAALVSLGILLLAGLLFFFIPRFSTGYLSRFAPKTQHIGGFSDNVTLGEIGDIKKSTQVIMRIRFQQPPPRVQHLRWRGVALTTFDGRRWYNPYLGSVILNGRLVPAFDRGQTRMVMSYQLRRPRELAQLPMQGLSYSVMLEPISSEHLFLIPTPQHVIGNFRMLEADANEGVLLRDRSVAAMRYDAWSNLAAPDATMLRAAPTELPARIGDNPRMLYLRVPDNLDPRIQQLARQVTAGASTNYDRARAIEEHLKTQFGYSLEMPFTGDDPLAGFLFNSKKGHCEYFASAMAIMARTLGIPTRIVNGFLPGEFNEISELYVVRASDAHSWVEAYFPNYGWVTFDPTPPAGTESRSMFYRVSLWIDAFQSFWVDWVVAYDFGRQFMLARNLDRGSRRATADAQDYAKKRYRQLAAWIRGLHASLKSNRMALAGLVIGMGVMFALLVGWGPMAGMFRHGAAQARSRAGRATPRDATLAYERLLDLLSRRGFQKRPSMSAREFVPVVTDPVLAPVVEQFTEVYEDARFGGSTERVPQLYTLLTQARELARRRS